jgi:hypothetical protein
MTNADKTNRWYGLFIMKLNSCTYNFVEVSRHNLEIIRLDFCMDFLNPREGGMVFYQVFLLSLYSVQ